MIIAIDGPSGTGKSTVAKGVAKRLQFVFFDTGAMYRSFAWKLSHDGILPTDHDAIQRVLSQFQFDIRTDEKGEKQYWVDGTDISPLIRTQEISTLSSQISALPFVRQALVQIQREFGRKSNAVFEGRDMGTVVFPDAEIKIFLTARPSVRAERRYQELCIKFPGGSFSQSQILREIEERDHKDTTRDVSPLRQAEDAILIDTSDLTVEQVIDRVIALYTQKCAPSSSPMRFSYRFVYLIARGFFKLFYRLRIHGLSHFTSGAGIIAANHVSFFDPPVVSISCPEEVHFLARSSLFRVPIFGWFIRHLNAHPIARDASDVKTFRLLLQLLEEGQKVILFPEGARARDGMLQPLEKGLSFIVYKAQCPIFPVYVEGTFQAWRRGQAFPRLFGRMHCVFGSPILWESFAALDKREAMEQITLQTHRALQNLAHWVHAGCQGEPP